MRYPRQILRRVIARCAGFRGKVFDSNLKLVKDGRNYLPTSANAINVLAASIATAYTIFEYRSRRWWATNVLAAALAISEIRESSRSTVGWATAKLTIPALFSLLNRCTKIQWADSLTVCDNLLATSRADSFRLPTRSSLLRILQTLLDNNLPSGGMTVKMPLYSQYSFARVNMQQLVSPGVLIALALKYDRFKTRTGRSSE